MSAAWKVIKNSVALSVSAFVERGAAIFIPWYIARYRGAQSLGYYSTALTFLTVSASFAQWGLGQLLPREVARYPHRSRAFLVSAWGIGILGSILAMAMAVAAANLLGYSHRLQELVWLGLGLALLPRTEMIIAEAVISGLERMEWIAVVRLATGIMRIVTVIYLLSRGLGLWVVFAALGGYHLTACGVYAFFITTQTPTTRITIGSDLFRLILQAIPFVAILSIGEAFKQFDRIFLSAMGDLDAVGMYSASMMILDISYLAARSLMGALMPGLSRMYTDSPERFAHALARYTGWLIALVFPASLIMAACAGWAVPVVFGVAFTRSSAVLGISAMGIAPSFAARLLFRSMIASDNERTAVKASIVKSTFNLVLNIILIPRYGIIGAGIAHACTEAAGFIQNSLWIHSQIAQADAIRILVPSAACMTVGGGVYWLLSGVNKLAALSIAMITFLAALLLLKVVTLTDLRAAFGGLRYHLEGTLR